MTFHRTDEAWRAKLFCRAGVLGLALTLMGCAPQGRIGSSPTPARILAAMKSACGGNAWDGVKGWHETGIVKLPGRPDMPHEIWHDMRTLKTAMINRNEGRVMRHAGYNGSAYWHVKPDGSVDIGHEPAKLRKHRRDAYLSSSGWFFPQRFPASISQTGTWLIDGTPHHVLRIAPTEADPFDLWVDAGTYRIRKIIAGEEYAELSDYKMFGGICSATIGRQGDGNPAHEIVLEVRTIETSKAIPAASFEPPVSAVGQLPSR